MGTSMRTRITLSAAGLGAGGALVLAVIVPALAAEAPTGPAANRADTWVSYVEDFGYTDVTCEKLEDGVADQPSWTADADYALVVVKAGSARSTATPNLQYRDVSAGDVLTASDSKDISHLIVCAGDDEPPYNPSTPPEEPTTTPSPTAP